MKKTEYKKIKFEFNISYKGKKTNETQQKNEEKKTQQKDEEKEYIFLVEGKFFTKKQKKIDPFKGEWRNILEYDKKNRKH